MSDSKETPLMKQYKAIKVKHPGALLLFRVGDFYETFGQDAVVASKILDIVLTKRSNGSASEVELAGFPHHALDSYLPRLVRAGQRVAICDQLEDPKSAKGIVKRGITELVTPGVSFNDNVLNVRSNNYLASVYFQNKSVGIAFLDISTGEFLAAQGDNAYASKLLQGFNPAEVIYCKTQKEHYFEVFSDQYNGHRLEDWVYSYDYGHEKLTQHFGTASLKGFGIDGFEHSIVAAGAILHYLELTEHKEIAHIRSISRIEEEKYVWLDKFTIRNLELLRSQHEGGVPLIEVLDRCITPMGARLLKKWLVLPLKSLSAIHDRLGVVRFFYNEPDLVEKILPFLRQIGDMERLISKVAVKRVNPRELAQLKRSLSSMLPIKQILSGQPDERIAKLVDQLNECSFLVEKIDKELKDQPPLQANQGNLINDGVNPELDELRQLAFSGKDYLLQIQRREVERTGISSLKIAYNKVFGYYLEVRNVHKDKVPPNWIRKQTLVNAERYITEELKVYEEKILKAEGELVVLEQKMFDQLVQVATGYVAQVQQNAITLARLDCLLSFTQTALENRYICPEVNEGDEISIKNGRHPVIEQQLPPGEQYVPNDVLLNQTEQQILVITGPNMAGKSALLRQVALMVLMAQIGSFIPADAATIGMVDKVFTRVGASDNLSKGESTFMVEMTETASILNNLSNRSLVLMDEIGRGTSTYDGISIAWSIVEHLHNHPENKAKTLFATHYHELNQLAEDLPRICNYNVSVKEVGGKIVFLRKLKPGGSEHSFGIHVAQLAGMPNQIVIRAAEIMSYLEQDKVQNQRKEAMHQIPVANYQLSLFEANDPQYKKLKEMLGSIDINRLSPVEALLKLNEIKQLMDRPNDGQAI